MVNFRDSYFSVQWDLSKKHLSGTFWGKQYDTGRGFTVTVINGGQVVTPTTEVLRLKWEKPDNTTGYVQATIVNGKFLIENIDQMFTVAGSIRADFELSVGGEVVASVTFYVSVEKSVAADAIESSSEFTALQTAIGTVDGLDAEMYSLQTDFNTFSATLQSDFNSLETQFNGVIANATVDSEVILARGTEATLGARLDSTDVIVRTNVINIKDRFRKSVNLVDPSTIIDNTAMSANGSLFTISGYYVTDYIKLNGKNVSGLWLSSAANPHLGVYDENFNFIRSEINTQQTYVYQPGDYYVRVVFRTTITPISSAMINYGNTRLPYTPYREISTGLSNVLYVGTQNGCDYKTIQGALDAITDDTVSNPYIIFVMPGIYERFSMIKPVKKLRYISLIGFDRVKTIIKSDTGTYETPPAEIFTNGTIENITFEMKTSAGTYTGIGGQPQAYAVHQDFGTSETLYKNCVMYSNAGPAGGFGTFENGKMLFHDCDFITESDNTYGVNTLGAMFIHTNGEGPAINQYAEFKNCNAVNKYGIDGIRLRVPTGSTGAYNVLVQNCLSWGVNGASAFVNAGILDPKSFGNNIASLNA